MLGRRLVDQITDELARLPTRPVTPAASTDAVRQVLGSDRHLPELGTDPQRLLHAVTEQLFEHSLFNGHPRFFGYVTSNPAPIGAFGDLLAAIVNANVSVWTLSPFATVLEPQTGRWIAALIGDTLALRERLEAENVLLHQQIRRRHGSEEIVGDSKELAQVFHKVGQVAPTDSCVLLTGETGTGKELIAKAIHARSRRKRRPLIKVNSAALPPTLIESELFGHERGVFTGAVQRRIGRFELADDATLFLDEVGELPLDFQLKLLRVLHTGEYERVGALETRRCDVRIVAATNRDLRRALEEGRFREALYRATRRLSDRTPSAVGSERRHPPIDCLLPQTVPLERWQADRRCHA